LTALPVYGTFRTLGLSPTGIIGRVRAAYTTDSFKALFASPAKSGFKTAQLGVPGSRMNNTQLSVAMAGNLLGLLAFLLGVGDDDDYITITGALSHLSSDEKTKHPIGEHTLVIGGYPIKYLSIPLLSTPLAIVGNYNDMVYRAKKEDPDFVDKSKLMMIAYRNSFYTVGSLQIAEGVQMLTDRISKLLGSMKQDMDRAPIKEDTKMFDIANEKILQTIIKDYSNLLGGATVITNNNLIQQTIKFINSESRMRRTPKQILLYNLGLGVLNPARTDIFDEPIHFLPGETNIAYPRDDDPRWQKIFDYNIFIDDVQLWGEKKIDGIHRDLTFDEHMSRKKLTNQAFKRRFDMYFEQFDEAELKKRSKQFTDDRGILTNQVNEDIRKVWADVKKSTDAYLFTWGNLKEGFEEHGFKYRQDYDKVMKQLVADGLVPAPIDRATKNKVQYDDEEMDAINMKAIRLFLEYLGSYPNPNNPNRNIYKAPGVTEYDAYIENKWEKAKKEAKRSAPKPQGLEAEKPYGYYKAKPR
jgi:hypothetical protein